MAGQNKVKANDGSPLKRERYAISDPDLDQLPCLEATGRVASILLRPLNRQAAQRLVRGSTPHMLPMDALKRPRPVES